MTDVHARSDEPQGGGTIKASEDFEATVTTECSRLHTKVCRPVAAQKFVHLG